MDGQSTLTGSASLSDQVQVLISELVTQLIKDVSEQYEAGLTAQAAILSMENSRLRERIAQLEEDAQNRVEGV